MKIPLEFKIFLRIFCNQYHRKFKEPHKINEIQHKSRGLIAYKIFFHTTERKGLTRITNTFALVYVF